MMVDASSLHRVFTVESCFDAGQGPLVLHLLQSASVKNRIYALSGSFRLLPILMILAACDAVDVPNPAGLQKGTTEDSALSDDRNKVSKVIHIPMGVLEAGSKAGEEGRDPAFEPLLHTLKLGPFRMDSHLIRDQNQQIMLGQSVEQAALLCASKQVGDDAGRLCTDAEWERACKGEGQTKYPGGNEACDGSCPSEFGVYELTEFAEWTSSTFRKNSNAAGTTIIRGSQSSEALETHRCARRRASVPRVQVAFRCCYGPKNAAVLKDEVIGPAYELTDVSVEKLTLLLNENEKTRALAKGVSLFSERAIETVFSRGPGESKGFSLTNRALFWQPAKGVKYLVVAGRSGKQTSFVVAYHQLGQQSVLAGSFVMSNEAGPVVLAFAQSIRPRLHFSSCWGCSGETGKLLFRPPEQLVLLQP